ncbi:MAG: caspase family protein [Pseudomonadales bacterium]|nr:caspase family protein [Pseudomonadales bacterium]
MNTIFRLTLFSLWLLTSPTFAAQKVALVIGNSQYQNVQDNLKNPVNDAKAIATRFKELGFDTEMLPNANLDTMLEAINRARSKVDANGTLVFYYAGHGVQLDGKNYLVPVDARMANPDRVQRETIQVKEVIDKFNDSSAAVRVLMLDACRNDPFPKAHRSGTRGLAREELQLNKGMMVLYAASQGEVAEDGAANHGTFTDALLRGLSQPNIKLPELMDDVTTQVQQKTQNKQNPYYEGTGLSRFVLVPASSGANTASPIADSDKQLWDEIKNSTDTGEYRAYLSQYPNGKFVSLAKARLEKYSIKPTSTSTTTDHTCILGNWELASTINDIPAPSIIRLNLMSKDILVFEGEDEGHTMSTAYRLDGKQYPAEEMLKLLPPSAMDGIDVNVLQAVSYSGRWNDECSFSLLGSMNGVVVTNANYKISGQIMAMDIAVQDPRDNSQMRASFLYKRTEKKK